MLYVNPWTKPSGPFLETEDDVDLDDRPLRPLVSLGAAAGFLVACEACTGHFGTELGTKVTRYGLCLLAVDLTTLSHCLLQQFRYKHDSSLLLRDLLSTWYPSHYL